MNEVEWLNCAGPTPMLEFLRGKASDRKFRLFAVTCCRAVTPLLTDNRSLQAAEVAEQYAEGLASLLELNTAARSSGDADTELLYSQDDGEELPEFHAACVATWAASDPELQDYPAMVARLASAVASPQQLARYARDIFGNPFLPVSVQPHWLTESVVSLAVGIFQERAFDRMPILADALEEAGCDNADILTHCRGDGPHVRGCWVVDLLLGKS